MGLTTNVFITAAGGGGGGGGDSDSGIPWGDSARTHPLHSQTQGGRGQQASGPP